MQIVLILGRISLVTVAVALVSVIFDGPSTFNVGVTLGAATALIICAITIRNHNQDNSKQIKHL